MKVTYLTWGETPRSYGVFGSQVIRQFVETRKLFPAARFSLVSGVPLFHSGWLREKFRYPAEVRHVRNRLDGVSFETVPIYAPQTIVNSSKRTFPWMHWGTSRHLKSILLRTCPDVLHCRSYHAAWAALQAKALSELKYKIVFDGRGLYPEEVALKKSYADHSDDYHFLKKIERTILENCDVAVAVSDPMEQHYRNLGASHCKTIYLSAAADQLRTVDRTQRRRGPGLTFCYVGALSESTWHKPSSLHRLFTHLRTQFDDAKLTIVTTSDRRFIRSCFSNFPEGVVQIMSARTTADVQTALRQADFGLMSYFEPSSPREIKLAEMVLAVKTAEYLCSGLPIIVNKFCEGAASLVRRNDMGVTYDPFHLNQLDVREIRRLSQCTTSAERISTRARELFDYKVHAEQYARLYEELAAEPD